MTQPPSSQPRNPTPQNPTEEEVAALLAAASDPGPTPPPVADRLDAVLADLVRERAEDADRVTALPIRPPRRRWPAALLAAAAITVGGFAVGTALDATRSGSDEAASDTTALDDGTDAGGAGSRAESSTPQQDGPARLGADSTDREGYVDRSGVVLTSAALADQVAALVSSPDLTAPDPTGPGQESAGTPPCPAPPLRPGDTWSVVTFDGELATLTLGAAVANTVVATVRDCADATVLATASVPATP